MAGAVSGGSITGAMESNGGDGVQLAGTVSSVVVGPSCIMVGNTGYGLNISVSGVSSTVVTGCEFALNTAGSITDSGTGTIKRTNVPDNTTNNDFILDTDTSLTADSDLRIATQKAVKAYVDGSSFSSPLTTKGDLFGFDTAGNRIPVGSNDSILTADSTATLGVSWKTAPVVSVAGHTGTVTLSHSDISGLGGLATESSVNLASEVTGILPAANGGAGTVNGLLKANGSGAVSKATSGTDYAPATSGSSILKGNGAGGFSSATSGTDYAPATSGSALLKGDGAGGFASATSGTDYAPATSGSSLLYGNGSGGFSSATVGTGLTFSAGTLSATGGGGGGGDMLAATYDPTSVAADAFSMDNMAQGTTNKFITSAELTVLGNTSGTNTGDQTTITGNAGTATKLATARAINGINFDGSVAINVPSVKWAAVTTTSQTAAINSGYITNNASLVTVTLPSTAAIGSTVRIVGLGAGGWKIAQAASQLVHFGSSVTTTGTGGSLASTNQYDAVELVNIVANTTWAVVSSQGNLTIV
jgi:hypothetical protein